VPGLLGRFGPAPPPPRAPGPRPGLVLALEAGGSVRGVAYRLPGPLALDELHLLWRREMVVGSYRPVWVRARAGARTIVALTFAIRRDHPQFVALTLDEQARTIATASGAFGSCCDYLMLTREALAGHGVADSYLEDLARRVDALRRA